jgi:uncharacterized protein (TIGR03437 family)
VKTALRRTAVTAILVAVSLVSVLAQTIITTFAGSHASWTFEGVQASIAPLGTPSGAAVDRTGVIYIADSTWQRVFRIDTKGVLTTAAGNGTSGYGGDGGNAASAAINSPGALATDFNGNLYVADTANFRVRMVNRAGVISTLAGTGTEGFSGDGGPAVSAAIGSPAGLAIDGTGNLYISDPVNHRIRIVTTDGKISTFAGTGAAASNGDGGPATSAALRYPAGLAVDGGGNVFVADLNANRVRRIGRDGVITTFAGNGFAGNSGDGGLAIQARLSPLALAFDAAGAVDILDQNASAIRHVDVGGRISTIAGTTQLGLAGDGGPAVSAQLNTPADLAFAPPGALIVADFGNFRVRSIASGNIYTIAGTGNYRYSGDGGDATAATLPGPSGLAIDAAGNVNICDTLANRIRTVDAFGVVHLTAGGSIPGFLGDGSAATSAALTDCKGIGVDRFGNLFFADTGNNRIRKVSTAGVISTVAGNGAEGFSGDGGQAVAAALNRPEGVSLDKTGTLYIADTQNDRIRKVTPDGIITTFAGSGANGFAGEGVPATAAQLSLPTRVTVDAIGNVFFSDRGNDTIRGVANGIIHTIAGTGTSGFSGDGGPAASAMVANPAGLAVDSAGALYFADSNNRRVRRVDTKGVITTFAGNGFNSISGDGRAPTLAGIGFPVDVAFDPAGNMYIADHGGRVRRVQPAPSSIVLSQTGFTFDGAVDSSGIAPKTLTILNGGAGTIDWNVTSRTISGNANWLQISPAQGSSTSTAASPPMTISVNPTGLAAGNYYGQLRITSPGVANSPRFVTVVLRVLAPSQTSGPSVAPAGFLFHAVAGAGNPPAQTLTISELGGSALTYTTSVTFPEGVNWLNLPPDSGSVSPGSPVKLALQANITGLAAQVYTASIALNFSDGSQRTVPATMTVTSAPSAQVAHAAAVCAPAKLLVVPTTLGAGFSVAAGWPVELAVAVTDDCGNATAAAQVTVTFTDGDPPLALTSLASGTWTGTWQPRKAIAVNVTFQGKTTTPSLQGSFQVSGQLTPNTEPPIIGPNGVLNAASFTGTAAPGALMAIFGSNLATGTAQAAALPLPARMANVQAFLGGEPLPLLYAGPGQINFMVPFDIATNSSRQLVVQNGSALSVPEEVQVAPAAPASFTLDGSGSGPAIVVAVPGSGSAHLVNTASPAHAGDTIVIYCTGLGGVDSALNAGEATPVSPLAPASDAISVTVGGQAAQVAFAGLVPTFTGLYQINAVLPAGLSGDALPLLIGAGTAQGPSATLAVR